MKNQKKKPRVGSLSFPWGTLLENFRKINLYTENNFV